MEANLPTTPGAYWWREKGGGEWILVILDKNHNPWNEEGYNMGLLSDMQGQWAKAHKPDEGVEAWAVFKNEEFLWSEPCLPARIFTESAFICEPVTICRKGKE